MTDKRKRSWNYKWQLPMNVRLSGAQLSEAIAKGDLSGHEFRGNQYTSGGGSGGKDAKAPTAELNKAGFKEGSQYEMEKSVGSMKEVEKTIAEAHKTLEAAGWKQFDSYGGTDKAPEAILYKNSKAKGKEMRVAWDNDGKGGFTVGVDGSYDAEDE